jgi:hypothetical protein
MKQHPRVIGVVPITHYPTHVFRSESERDGKHATPRRLCLAVFPLVPGHCQNHPQLVSTTNRSLRTRMLVAYAHHGSGWFACGRIIRWAFPCKWIAS